MNGMNGAVLLLSSEKLKNDGYIEGRAKTIAQFLNNGGAEDDAICIFQATPDEIKTARLYSDGSEGEENLDDDYCSKEREIGKQMLLVDIIHTENDIITSGGTSFLSIKKFAKYAHMEEDEAEKFIKTVNSLLLDEIAVSAAKKVCKKKDNSYMWLMDTFGYWGEVVLKILDAESVISFLDNTVMPNYERYMKKWGKVYPVEESFGTIDTFTSAMIGYMDYFVNTVNEVLDQGYSWPVVAKMLGGKMDKSKFINLEDIAKELK